MAVVGFCRKRLLPFAIIANAVLDLPDVAQGMRKVKRQHRKGTLQSIDDVPSDGSGEAAMGQPTMSAISSPVLSESKFVGSSFADKSLHNTGLDRIVQLSNTTRVQDNFRAVTMRLSRLARTDIQSLPADELVTAVFVLLSFLYASKLLLVDLGLMETSKRLRLKRDSITESYNVLLGDLASQLKYVRNSTEMSLELEFRGQSRAFQSFLKDLAKDFRKFVGKSHSVSLALNTFKRYLHLYLKVFEQCSLDPRNDPRRVVTKSKLNACTSIKDLAELVAQRMAANRLVFISDLDSAFQSHKCPLPPRPNSTNNADGRPRGAKCCSWLRCGLMCGCSCSRGNPFPIDISCTCIGLKLHSGAHIRVIILTFLGMALITLHCLKSKFWHAATVSVIVALFIVVLFWIEELEYRCRLDKEVKRLTKEQAQVEEAFNPISDRFRKMEKNVSLWKHRTHPHLGLFHNLNFQLAHTPDREKLAFLNGIIERLERIDHALGDLSRWVGSAALEEKYLMRFGAQLEKVSDFIKNEQKASMAERRSGADAKSTPSNSDSDGKLILERLSSPFGLVAVRVIACHNLKNKGRRVFGEVSSPYVTVAIKDTSKTFRTPTISDSLNPKWDAESGVQGGFEFFTVSAGEHMLEIQVWDEAGGTREDTPMSSWTVDFTKDAPGSWYRRMDDLCVFGTTQIKDEGQIEFEFCYANTVDMLRNCLSSNSQMRNYQSTNSQMRNSPSNTQQRVAEFLKSVPVQ